MENKRLIKLKGFLSFMSLGLGGWNLWKLLLAGVILSYFAGKVFLPYVSGFYILFLFSISYVSSSYRDTWFSGNTLSLLLLWPVHKTKKFVWIQFRGTWLPALLILLGATIGSLLFESNIWEEGIFYLIYALSAAYLIGVLSWKGIFTAVDAGALVGNIGCRQGNRLDTISILLCLSPIMLGFIPYSLVLFISMGVFILSVLYGFSDRDLIQVSGAYRERESASNTKRNLGFLTKIKSPAIRYFCYLEMEFLRNPLVNWLTNLAGTTGIVFTFYVAGGYLSGWNEISAYQRGLFLGLLIAYGVFYLQNAIDLESGNESLEIMLPFSKKKQFLVKLASQFLRQAVYVVINSIIIVNLVFMAHKVLAMFMPEAEILYVDVSLVAIIYSVFYVPFVLGTLSGLKLISRAMLLFFQQLSLYNAAKVFSKYFFITHFLPLFLLILGISQRLWVIENLLSLKWIVLSMIAFTTFEFGLYWNFKKQQVI